MLSHASLRGSVLLLAGAATLHLTALPALSHDDPGKVLGFEPAYQGAGFRNGDASTHGNRLTSMGSQDVTLQSWLTIPELDGASGAMDIWGYVSPSGREYAIIGTTASTVFVEVTDPANATKVGVIPGTASGWRDMKTFGEYCYSVNEGGGGIQIIDLSAIDSGTVTLANTVNDIQGNSHNVFIDTDSGFLYRCGVSGAGVAIYDLNPDPSTPQNVAFWANTYVHDLQVKTMPSGPFAGRQLAFLNTPGGAIPGLTILDVTDKQNLVQVGGVAYPNEGYSHQGWLSEDLTRFYVNDEFVVPAPTVVLNVADPANPFWENTFDNGIASNAHNCFVDGDLLYAANYKQGMRVFDLSVDPINPPEVGFFDTYPADDSSGYSGLWGVYPFLPSGTVLGSDRSSGLFVWTLGPRPLEVEAVTPPISTLNPAGGQTAQISIVELEPSALDTSSPTLLLETPSGSQSLPLMDLGGGFWEGTFPALPCGDLVTYQFQVLDVLGGIYETEAVSSLAASGVDVVVQDDLESPSGWTVGAPSDTAITGVWERVDPVGTSAQPEDDESPAGTLCWVTGQGLIGGGVGDNDVDGGATTLFSPTYDLTGYENAQLRYSMWYSNTAGSTPNTDTMVVRISNDAGATWQVLDEVGPTGPGTSGGWLQYSFHVGSILPVSDAMQLSFVASDLGDGSIVEAAVDEVTFIDLGCYEGLGELSCEAAANSTGASASIGASGSDAVADNDLTLNADSLPANQFGYFLTSMDAGFVPMVGSSMGNLCLSGTLGRFAGQIQNSGPGGSFAIPVDLTMIPVTPMVAVQPGDTWRFQAWFRDNVGGTPTSNLTNLVSIAFQ